MKEKAIPIDLSSFKHKGVNVPLRKRGKTWWLWKVYRSRSVKQTLGTSDLNVAKRNAKKLIDAAIMGRWEAVEETKQKRKVCTLREITERLEPAVELKLAPRTVKAYVRSLSRLVAYGLGMPVDSAPNQSASILTKKLVVDCQRAMLADAGNDLLRVDERSESANTIYRSAKAVFGRKVMAAGVYDGLTLPDLAEFRAVPMLPVLKKDRYELPDQAVLDRLWEDAPRLYETRPRLWLAWKLSVETGMRRGESLAMRWRWFTNREDGQAVVRVSFESDFVPKGKREREIPVRPVLRAEIQALFLERGWPCDPADYVIPKGVQGGMGLRFGDKERKERGFRGLSEWMKSHGWDRRQASHELRKVYASWACKEYGAYAAKELLGHMDLKTTERYAAKPKVGPVVLRYGSAVG
jgi:integrase